MQAKCLIGVISCFVATSVFAQTGVDGIIRDAIQHGAHPVVCQDDQCVDQVTKQSVKKPADAADGTYLVYPNTQGTQSAIQDTQKQVRNSNP